MGDRTYPIRPKHACLSGKAGLAKRDSFRGRRPEAPRRWTTQLLISLFTSIGLTMDLEFHGTAEGAFDIVRNLLGSFSGFHMNLALLIPGLYLVYRLANLFRAEQGGRTRRLLAAFFAINMVLGFAFEQDGSWRMLQDILNGQLVKAAFVGFSWYIVFNNFLVLVFHVLNIARITMEQTNGHDVLRYGIVFSPARWYSIMLRRHPFGTPFWTLFILILPHLCISYPAMFMGDTGSIIVQAYSELGTTGTDYLSPDSVIKAGVYINQHHPVFYTLLVHAFLELGDWVFRSLNAGIFLYVLCQAGMMIVAFSYAVSTFVQQRVQTGYCVAALIYILVHPLIHNYLVLVTKEGLYSACFLIMLVSLFRLRLQEKKTRESMVLIVSALGVILLRNEGRYFLLLSGLLMALVDRQNRKRIIGFTAASLVISIGIYNGLYIYLGYTPGSIREMLSVPFQQTARYVQDHPEEVTAEEKAAINGVLEYDSLAEVYVAGTADPVKYIFREEATIQDLFRYFRAWARMLIRHPGTYIQATYANYDQYFYPGEAKMLFYTYGWMENICENTNEMIHALGKSFSLPEWSKRFRTLSDSFIDAGILNFPILSFLMTPAVYCWCILTVFGWSVGRSYRINPEMFCQNAPAAVILLILLLGPTNGFYGRYIMPLIEYLPFLLLMLPLLRQQEEKMVIREGVPA